MAKIRILIADDHAILRAGLRALINAQPDMEVVSEAANGREAVGKAHDMKPDVVLMDITMPGSNGIHAVKQVLQVCPHTRVLVLTMHDDPAYVRSALAAGGAGYVVKSAADSELLFGIRSVYRGHTFVDPSVAGSLVQGLLGRKTVQDLGATFAPRNLLSPREEEVLLLVAQGYTNPQVAKRICVGVKTVETYRSRIAEKLELRSRAELTRYALESGLLTPDRCTSKAHHFALK